MLNDKRIQACISRYDNGAYSRMQFLAPVSQSMCAHAEALCLTADDSSSSDDGERYEASPATMSESSESPTTAAAVLICLHLNQWSISVQSSILFGSW